MSRVREGNRRFTCDIPEELFKEFTKGCIEEGIIISKKDYLVRLLEEELYNDFKEK